MENKKLLLIGIIIISSLILSLTVLLVSKKYFQRVPEVFQQAGVYPSSSPGSCPAGHSCSGCSTSCNATDNCPGTGSCSFSRCVCYADNTTCGPFCNVSCPPGCQPPTVGAGTCTVNCTPCSNSQSCICGGASPSPSNPPPPSSKPSPSSNPSPSLNPTPSPSLPPSPNQNLVCSSLTRNPTTTLNIGDPVTFICAGTPINITINHYEFQISSNGGITYTSISNSDGNSISDTYTIPTAGSYIVQCRACSSINSNHCTTWGEAGGWTP